jgi:glycosyltransferase involved in cell wall biosynthesis
MIEGKDIICFGNDWDGDPLSKKHIMLRLAERNRILWVNSIGNRNPTASMRDFRRVIKKLRDFAQGSRNVERGIHICAPLAVPFHGNAAARWINRRVLQWSIRRVCRKLGFNRPISWSFVPASAEVVGSLGESTVVYHCVDENTGFTGTDKDAIRSLEQQLMAKSDCVFVSSGVLLQTNTRHNPNTFLVTHGVDVQHFRKACDPATAIPDDIRSLPKPIVGFFGLIADWVDLGLIRFLAQSRPQWTFVLIGKAVTSIEPVNDLANVHLLGQKPYLSLPDYAKAFDVALMPFVMNQLTLAANPLKIREYLAAGLPVVSSAIPEAEKLKYVLHVARSHAEFQTIIDGLIQSGKTGPQISISEQMDCESWDAKVEEFSRILANLGANQAV